MSYTFDKQSVRRITRAVLRSEGAPPVTQRVNGPPTRFPRALIGKWIRFKVSADFTTADETFEGVTDFASYTDEPDTTPVTIYNLPSKPGGYVFAGEVDFYGYANWSQQDRTWHCWQLECVDEGAGAPGYVPEP